MTEDIILLKQPSMLWASKEITADEAYRNDINDVTGRLSTVRSELGKLRHELHAVNGKHASSAGYEKREILGYSLEHIENFIELLTGSLGTYKEASAMLVMLYEAQAAYAEHHLTSLFERNRDFNSLLTDLNYYMLNVERACRREIDFLQTGNGDGNNNDETELYKNFMKTGLSLNKSLDKQIMYIDSLLRDIRKQMAVAQVSRLEEQVAERRRQISERRYKDKIEDVRDYEDLEGQYRHKYDEEGNLIGTEEGGRGGNRQGIKAIIIAVALVIIAIAANYFISL